MLTRPIRFLHRHDVVEIDDLPPTTTVLDWLRDHARCSGTKEGCAEGDCGACTVVVAEPAPADPGPMAPRSAVIDGVLLRPINACMRLLPTLDGKALFTVEDLRALAGGDLHPVQQALVDAHGSQCGFCTPGFVMTLFATYVRHQAAGSRPSRADLADELAGNLCRCTGYRPILDAGQQMLALPPVRFDATDVRRRLQALRAPEAIASQGSPTAGDTDPGFTYAAANPAVPTASGARIDRFHAPRTVEALATLRERLPHGRLLAGATDIGVWINKQFRDVGDLLYLGDVEALRRIEEEDGWLRIGAAVSLEDGWAALAARHPALHDVWVRFASPPVRHAGTLVGNLANGSPIGDGAPVLIALAARLVLRRGGHTRRMALEAFYLDYMKNALEPGEFVAAVEIPALPADSRVRAYKLSKRRDSDISAVCAGLAVRVTRGRVVEARLAYGGMAATVRRASGAERALLGEPWGETPVRAAMAALATDFAPMTDLRASASYRITTAANLLWRLWLECRDGDPLAPRLTQVRPALEADA